MARRRLSRLQYFVDTATMFGGDRQSPEVEKQIRALAKEIQTITNRVTDIAVNGWDAPYHVVPRGDSFAPYRDGLLENNWRILMVISPGSSRRAAQS